MMQDIINNIIYDLLLEYDYVTIPNFGGLVSSYRPASINSEKNIILPPGKKVSFNGNLKEDDGLLVKQLAKIQLISDLESKKIVDAFVQNLFSNLDSGKKISLGKIGTIKFNTHLNIEFDANLNENLNPYSYGMVHISCSQISSNQIIINKNKSYVSKKNLMRAAIILPFFIVGTVLSIYLNHIHFFSAFNQKEIASFFDFSKSTPIQADSLEKSYSSNSKSTISDQIDFLTNKSNALAYTEPIEAPESKLEEAKSVEKTKIAEQKKADVVEQINTETPQLEKEIKTASHKYQLVAGSFNSKENAERLLKKIKSFNFEGSIIEQGHKYRVIAASFENKSDASYVKDTLAKKKISTWINTLP